MRKIRRAMCFFAALMAIMFLFNPMSTYASCFQWKTIDDTKDLSDDNDYYINIYSEDGVCYDYNDGDYGWIESVRHLLWSTFFVTPPSNYSNPYLLSNGVL